MKYRIEHESKGRFRLKLAKQRLTTEEADVLYYTLLERDDVETVKVLQKSAQVIVHYYYGRKKLLEFIGQMNLKSEKLKENVPEVSSRATNEEFKEEIWGMVLKRYAKKLFLPAPIRAVFTLKNAAPFIYHGLKDLAKREFSAEVVHASAIGASLLIGDFATASSITFLTEVGEVLEEWTLKKSVNDLAQSLALNITKVWRVEGGVQELVNIDQIKAGDQILVTMGNMIPLDGIVVEGDAMVNQAALTGEAIPVRKTRTVSVFAGTVVEEGELIIEVKETSGETRYDKIVKMIEESESMVSVKQSHAEQVVSKLIPYTFGTSVATFLLTGNITKALSVLMVDFSCAIEVAMPIAVLSSMREAGRHRVTVKGGHYLEQIAQADTIVFDKTGTLTKAEPTVKEVIAAEGGDPDEMLRIAACLEEHFPHSLANAVVRAAAEKGLDHEEMHSKAVYIVAHGIESMIGDDRVVIGSYHYVFEDEKVSVTPEDQARIDALPAQYSLLYMAIGGKLAAIIGIADPIKKQTKQVIEDLRNVGIKHIVMMTGDSERTAAAIAAEAGITEYYSEVLPEDKARYVEQEKAAGRKVIMIGDGINDSPALSAADVGIAIKEGADIAQQISDITISGTDLNQLVDIKVMSDRLMKRMANTSVVGISFNAGIMIAGIAGLVAPGTAALLHNTSTIGLCLKNMSNLLPDHNYYVEDEEEVVGTVEAVCC